MNTKDAAVAVAATGFKRMTRRQWLGACLLAILAGCNGTPSTVDAPKQATDDPENTNMSTEPSQPRDSVPLTRPLSLATEGGKFYTFNVDYRQQPEAFVYEIGEKRPEKKANVILTDNIIPAGERDQVMSRVYNAKRGIFNKGIVRNKIVFSVNNLHIYDNLLLFTFEIENKSKLPYDIDYIRYYIIDKKTAKLTASQEVDQQALFSENYSPRIEGNGRMKYVIAFDKFTIPDEKVFRIEINEKNGGRHVLFDLENSDIVNVEDI